VHRKLNLGGTLFLAFCAVSAVNALFVVIADRGAVIPKMLVENKGIVLFLCFILFVLVLVAYVTRHPNRRSFWWKCALSCVFPPAFFYLLMTALHEPATKKVQKSANGEQTEFTAESF
jgi:hypothetical protein